MKKIRIGVLFGGQSAEHEVSLQSAKNVIATLNKKKYDPVLIGINKEGRWFAAQKQNIVGNSNIPGQVYSGEEERALSIIPTSTGKELLQITQMEKFLDVDVVFPVLHGTKGEDGTVQGLLELLNVPYVGSGVLGSAISMDKDVTKRLLLGAGVNVADYQCIREEEKKISYHSLKRKLGLVMFIKPANAGSSVGVSKVQDEKEFKRAVNLAFRFDNKILIEKAILGRELECSVLGNENPEASLIGEIKPKDDFYSYEAKYILEDGAALYVPAKLPKSTVKKMQKVAIETFQTLECEGMARVDMFLTQENEIFVNEVNTIPGFTQISMYPKLWEVSGMSYSKLLDQLIQLAIKRHKRNDRLQTSLAKK